MWANAGFIGARGLGLTPREGQKVGVCGERGHLLFETTLPTDRVHCSQECVFFPVKDSLRYGTKILGFSEFIGM